MPTMSRLSWAVSTVVFGGLVAAGLWHWFYDGSRSSPAQTVMTCDMGISSAKANRDSQSAGKDAAAVEVSTAQPVPVSTQSKPAPLGPTPDGMAWIPGGEFWMGADEFSDAQP